LRCLGFGLGPNLKQLGFKQNLDLDVQGLILEFSRFEPRHGSWLPEFDLGLVLRFGALEGQSRIRFRTF
jgi:hypothetical protein